MKEQWNESTATAKGLYDPSFEHDNCGIGAVVNIKGIKTHQTVENALKIVENLKHRAGKDADGKTGDGVGILLQISHKFFKKAVEPLGIKLGEERDYGVGMFFLPTGRVKTQSGEKDVRGHCRQGGNGVPRMETGTDSSGQAFRQGKRMYAMHYAGIYQTSG